MAYADVSGGCPDDGPPGGNSPYTAALLEQLDEPGVEIGLMFRRVAAAVSAATDGRQQPAVYLTLRSEFYLSR